MTQARGDVAIPERPRPEKKGDGKGNPIARLSLFVRQVIAELRKVTWPTRQQLVTYWTVVLVFVLAVIGIVSVMDIGIGRLIFWLLG